MSERKKQIFLEALKKAKKESVMGKLANGDTDPMEPWSKKHAPLDEVNAQVLWRYIKAMGRDPRTISLNDRLNLARTDRFKKFARDHVKLIQQQKEEVEHIDEISAETKASYKEKAKAQVKELQPHAKGEYGDIAKRMIARRKKGIKMASEKNLDEMDKSAPQPGRDGKVSFSTYGSRDKKGDDYFKGKESPVKPITVKKMEKDALDILKKQGVAEVWKGHSSTVKNPNFNDELSYRRVNPVGKRLKSGKLSADERGSQERTKALIKYTQKRGGLAGPKGPLPEEQCVAEENINEAGTGLLMSYIKSKGLDPRAMDGNQKNKYSQSSEFKLFKHRKMKAETSGMGERGEDWNEEKKPVKEAIDQKDTVTMDIPLLIRVLEFIREDVKTDMDLHRVVENLIELRTLGVLTMDHYDKAVNIKKIKEEVKQIDEVSTSWINKKSPDYASKAHKQSQELGRKVRSIFKDTQATSDEKSKYVARKKGLNSYRKKSDAEYAKARGGFPSYQEPEKRLGGYDPRSNRSYSEEVEQIVELKKQSDTQDMDSHITREEKKMKGPDPCWKGYQMVGTKKKDGRTVPNCVPEETIKEGIYGIEDSPMSATNSVKAMESRMTKEKSKSARIIKAIYKKKGIKETLYDWEKSEKNGSKGDDAKIVLKGGKTMTGKDRDIIEIEPVVRTKLGANGTKPNL